jgi:FtsP/CotA-like multicopper oxidase with cupredoxin domain
MPTLIPPDLKLMPDPAPVSQGRRSFFKAGGAAAATICAPSLAPSQVGPGSPATAPWLEPLPVQTPLQATTSQTMVPSSYQIANPDECGRDDHPSWTGYEPEDCYQIEVKPGWHKFHPHLPASEIWGYGGTYPGPLIHARYGHPVLVRFYNKLPAYAQGYGSPDISVHLHNLHTPSESDGFPTDWWSSSAYGPTMGRAGLYKDHHYPMVCAGVDKYGKWGDPREAMGTLWYHDHRIDFTAGNVYRGMAGFFIAFDAVDSGNERDTDPRALRLPSGEFDVPLLLADKQFDSSGYLRFNQFDSDGFIGDKQIVNGKIQPYFRVQPRKYRFRLLDGAVARTFDLQVHYQGRVQSFFHIASDGCLFQNPISRTNVHVAPAERADILVDFSKFPPGAEVYLVNRLYHLDGRKPENDFLAQPVQLLKFIVDKPLAAPDYSRVPSLLREQPTIDNTEVKQQRTFVFGRSNGAWSINDKLWENKPVAKPKLGSAEIWHLVNDSGGWAHPVHIHFEQGRIIRRNGLPPPAWERGRKDVYFLGPNERVSVFLRFRDFPGRYIMHCHNLIHEDHAMMIRYDIED